jgi:hypothetical protein
MEQNYNDKNEQEYQDDNKNNEFNQNQEAAENEQLAEVEGEGEDDDDRLTYTLITLDLGNLIHIFEDNSISFVDMLLLTKEDLIELQLEIFQRNRILNFSKLFTKYAKNYSIQEISDFFTFNKQFIFNSIIYDKVSSSNINNEFQNEMNNPGVNNENNYNMAFEENNNDNPEVNYLNTEPNSKVNINNNMNNNNFLMTQKLNNRNYKGNIKNTTNQIMMPKVKETHISTQNSNGALNPKIMNKNLMIQKDNKNKKIGINNNMNNVENNENLRNKFMDVIQKKKIAKPKLDKNINKGININKGKMIHNEINKNVEFNKIIEKIGILEGYEMNYDFYTRLNLIKNYINMKGDKMSSEDLININNDIQTMLNNINNNNFKMLNYIK